MSPEMMSENTDLPSAPQKPFIIPVFLPHAGCPHRCAFCNQSEITQSSGSVPSSAAVGSRIATFLNYKGGGRGEVQVAFYGGNFLGLTVSEIQRLLAATEPFFREGSVHGIRCSTRPDTITPDRLDLLSMVPVSAVELGVQSMDDRILARVRRGHTAADTREAVRQLKSRGLKVGLQTMVGLPGDTSETAMETARAIVDLAPDFVRIYPTVVLKNSLLAHWYRQGRYVPLSMEEAVSLVAHLHALFSRHGIPVIRMGLQASSTLDDAETILAGPYHPAFGHLVLSKLFLSCAVRLLDKAVQPSAPVAIHVHPRNISKMRGLGNKNIEILKELFHIDTLGIVPDSDMAMTAVRAVQGGFSDERAIDDEGVGQ
ncbi:elongator complex protein 3 [Desulfococcus multivorans]|nr:radical SAM protein [Desulfococcus multivorans]